MILDTRDHNMSHPHYVNIAVLIGQYLFQAKKVVDHHFLRGKAWLILVQFNKTLPGSLITDKPVRSWKPQSCGILQRILQYRQFWYTLRSFRTRQVIGSRRKQEHVTSLSIRRGRIAIIAGKEISVSTASRWLPLR